MLNRRSTEKQGKFTVKSYPKVAEELSTKKTIFTASELHQKNVADFS